jgi:hypothetical protein
MGFNSGFKGLIDRGKLPESTKSAPESTDCYQHLLDKLEHACTQELRNAAVCWQPGV